MQQGLHLCEMRKTILLLFLLQFAFLGHAQSSADILAYILKYKQIALEQENRYGIPASITLAQGILESGAGKSMLTRNANNHFGVKAFDGWSGSIYLAWDDEKQKSRFRSYSSAMESYIDHSLFFKNNSRYNSLFTKSVYDYRAWAIGLQKAGYATACNYAKALIGYIDAYKLYSINGGVKLKAGKTVTITKLIAADNPTFDPDCIMEDNEVSDEQNEVTAIINRSIVDINDVRCTILYPGESLASISMRYDIPQQHLLDFNEISSPESLKVGDIVFLQKKKDKYTGIEDYYKVKEEDTLYGIAQQFGVNMACLAHLNHKDFFSKLSCGEKIRLK